MVTTAPLPCRPNVGIICTVCDLSIEKSMLGMGHVKPVLLRLFLVYLVSLILFAAIPRIDPSLFNHQFFLISYDYNEKN